MRKKLYLPILITLHFFNYLFLNIFFKICCEHWKYKKPLFVSFYTEQISFGYEKFFSFAACLDSLSYDWRSGSPCCESILSSSDMEQRAPSSVDTFLAQHARESSRWSSRFVFVRELYSLIVIVMNYFINLLKES